MPNILGLPVELRDHVWSYVFPQGSTYGSSSTIYSNNKKSRKSVCASLKLICQQINAELTQLLYRSVILDCRLPGDILRWIAQIGVENSSNIETLVLKTRSLPSDGTPHSWLYETGWALALKCMPSLRSLTIHFEHVENSGESSSINCEVPAEESDLVQKLTELALASCDVSPEQDIKPASLRGDYRPDLSRRPYTHGVFSLNEKMPSVLLSYWNKSTRYIRDTVRFTVEGIFTCETMEENLTGLAPQFFEQNGLALINTCTFNENNEHPNAYLTFTRKATPDASATGHIRTILQGLPSLQYLRVGSQELDSTFLRHVPKTVNTLDVAFRDDDPQRIADNVLAMRLMLWNLFTLAIEVSPLHDRKPADADDLAEHFFDRKFVSQETQERWAPFWEVLDHIKASKVKVWEGEGPGFRRAPRRINGDYLRS